MIRSGVAMKLVREAIASDGSVRRIVSEIVIWKSSNCGTWIMSVVRSSFSMSG